MLIPDSHQRIYSLNVHVAIYSDSHNRSTRDSHFTGIGHSLERPFKNFRFLRCHTGLEIRTLWPLQSEQCSDIGLFRASARQSSSARKIFASAYRMEQGNSMSRVSNRAEGRKSLYMPRDPALHLMINERARAGR